MNLVGAVPGQEFVEDYPQLVHVRGRRDGAERVWDVVAYSLGSLIAGVIWQRVPARTNTRAC